MFFPSRLSPKFCICTLQEHEPFLQNTGQQNLNWWELCRFGILLSLCIVECLRSSGDSWWLSLGSYLMVVDPKQLRHEFISLLFFHVCIAVLRETVVPLGFRSTSMQIALQYRNGLVFFSRHNIFLFQFAQMFLWVPGNVLFCVRNWDSNFRKSSLIW